MQSPPKIDLEMWLRSLGVERLGHLQSQSKLLGYFSVFLPSQCWCARFGELTAINNIGRTRRRGKK